VEKISENNQQARKVGQVVNRALTLGSNHDKIQAQWVSNISLESMLEKT